MFQIRRDHIVSRYVEKVLWNPQSKDKAETSEISDSFLSCSGAICGQKSQLDLTRKLLWNR